MEVNNMNKDTVTTLNDMRTLVENASTLMTASAEVAGENVAEARKRLDATIENVKKIAYRSREKAIEAAKATDKAVRENPYQAVGIALSVGALLGFFIYSRCSNKTD